MPRLYAAGTLGSKSGIEVTGGGSGGLGGSEGIGGSEGKDTKGSEETGGSVSLLKGGSKPLLDSPPLLSPGEGETEGSAEGDVLGLAEGEALGPAEGEADGEGETALPAMWSEPPLQVRGMLSGE